MNPNKAIIIFRRFELLLNPIPFIFIHMGDTDLRNQNFSPMNNTKTKETDHMLAGVLLPQA